MNVLWWLQAILTAAEIAGAFFFLKSVFHLRERNRCSDIILVLGCMIYVVLTIYQRSSSGMYSRYYMILSILYAGLVGSICLKGHLDEIWLPLALYFETLYYLDLSGYIIAYISWPEGDVFGEIHQNLGVERIVIYLVSRTLMAAFILLLIRESRKVRELFEVNRWMWIAVPLLEHISLYACDVILVIGYESAGIRNWRVVLLIWPLLLVVMVCLVGLQKYKMRNEQLEQKNRMYAIEYELNQKSMLKKERVYHDIKNHLILLQKMAKEREFSQLEGYIDRLLEPIKTEAIKEKTGNPLLDYLLQEKENAAQEKGILVESVFGDVNIQVEDQALGDWCALLGNLWDNAIEGCERVEGEQKWINFKFRQTGIAVLIRMDNSCNPAQINRGLRTVKKGKDSHGIGMRSIRYVVSKYNGRISWKCEDNVFHIEIVLSL